MAKSNRLFTAKSIKTSDSTDGKFAHIKYEDLSEDQLKAFKELELWTTKGCKTTPLLAFGGYAGTGKTTVLGVLADQLGAKGKNAAFCAYTGRASSILKRKLFSRMYGHSVSTIHSLIYKPLIRNETVVGWDRKSHEEMGGYDFIVVDEASMVDEAMMADLMYYDIPILAVGDPAQLPPISGTGPMCTEPDVLLSTIHRQAENNPIISLSKYIREHGKLPSDIKESEEIRYSSVSELQKQWMQSYGTVGQDEVLCLTYTNATRCSINSAIRKWKGLPADQVVNGDHVIVLRNNNTVFNGMRGCVTRAGKVQDAWQALDVVFPYESLEITAEVLLDQFGRSSTHNNIDVLRAEFPIYGWKDVGLLMDYGYCLTVHKAQGSEAKHVYLFTDTPSRIDSDTKRKWLYTAVTRASERLYIL